MEAGCLPYTDYVYLEAISKINKLMKMDRN